MLGTNLSLLWALVSGGSQTLEPPVPYTPFEGKVQLNFDFVPKQKLDYTMGMKSDTQMSVTNGLGDQAFTLEVLIGSSYLFGDKPDRSGSLGFNISRTVKKFSMGDMVPSSGSTGEVLGTGTVDSRGRVRNLNFDLSRLGGRFLAAGTTSSSTNIWLDLPEEPVGVGDTWTSEIVRSPFISTQSSFLNVRLVGKAEYKKRECYACAFSGTILVEGDMTPILKAEDRNLGIKVMRIKGTIDLVGYSYIDKLTGRTLLTVSTTREESTSTIDQDVEVVMKGKGMIRSELTTNLSETK